MTGERTQETEKVPWKEIIVRAANGALIESYEGRLAILTYNSDYIRFKDEEDVRREIFNKGGFIIINCYPEKYFDE